MIGFAGLLLCSGQDRAGCGLFALRKRSSMNMRILPTRLAETSQVIIGAPNCSTIWPVAESSIIPPRLLLSRMMLLMVAVMTVLFLGEPYFVVDISTGSWK